MLWRCSKDFFSVFYTFSGDLSDYSSAMSYGFLEILGGPCPADCLLSFSWPKRTEQGLAALNRNHLRSKLPH